ncbi:30S ribosomal protein S20 [Lentisphaerota bacterium WC36G]|nr:30S ribosomal protein S20 [Lentisphaerae bacterium WC36]
MPHNKSTLKRLITSKKKHVKNKARKSAIKTAEKKLRAAVEAKDAALVAASLKDCFKLLDKGTKTNIVHANKANRKKSQLAQLANTVK